ncbi:MULTISPECIES: hypothetical protein [Vibrio]|jgi:CHASE2 domain-containing sensor protein|uniref:hypothetical protein n=1 Tax=Vibrio TaxID=662 RepID=UPI000BFFA454|nr:hypothetical protein [Vibrio sp. PID17_43]PHJ43247.1 hypothetical protein AK965_01800 [Vibrio sp. PID17_43]
MDKFVVFLLCLYLTFSGVIHIYDNIIDGFLPYNFAPGWLNAYWSALGLFSLLAVYLLITHRRSGIVLMIFILLSKVAFNSYAYYVLDVLESSRLLQWQTLLLGFSIGVSIWLWNSQKARHSRHIFR